MNHFYQVIRGKKTFTIHEYMFGVRSTNSMVYPIDEMSRQLRMIPKHFQPLAVIHCSDANVKFASDYKNKV